MWSQLLLCALVGLAAASSSNNAWKTNTQYVYQVHGRTLTGLPDVADQYSGMVMKAKMIVQAESEDKLKAKIVDAQYAQIHTQLPGGWKSEIPEGKLNYQQLPLSERPFEIVMKNGVVRDIIVDKEVSNWEANILKSIVSQIQLDTQGEHVIKSHINQLPEESTNNAVFKTMEDTVTGKYETLYDISPLPEYVLQSKPWLAPLYKGDGELIEIVKNKNFSRSEERVGYHYGLHGMGEFEPNTNKMADFFVRSSVSRAIVSGSLKRYTIQSSETTNKIILSPTLNNGQNGMVVSQLNLTLQSIDSSNKNLGEIAQPQRLGSLVYRYNNPFSGETSARPGQQRQERQGEHNIYGSSSSEEHQQRQHHYRQRRSAGLYGRKQEGSNSDSYSSLNSEEYWQQEQPQLHSAPASPLLPLYIGNKGQSIKRSEKINIVHAVQKLSQQIGQELERPEKIPAEQTLAKFNILTSLVRIMNQKEMQEVAGQLYNKEKQGAQRSAWIAYRDAIAECGTGPALLTIQEWIQTKKIEHEEAAEVVAAMAQSTRQPTEEYMRTFYALATKHEVKTQAYLNDTAILAFSNLVRKVYVDKHASHNQYPVHCFGTFRTEQGKEFVAQEVIPQLAKMLEHAIENAETHKIHVYIRALGNVAHQKILAAFEPYLEGEKQVSQFQRLAMVLAMDKLTNVHPKIARSVLYKIYQNAAEQQEVRAAAVYQLMRTCPPASMLQRMAQYTNVDTHEQVNAAVKSSIQSAAKLQGAEYEELRENARSAESLLTPKVYGIQYSRNELRSYVVREMNLLYKQTVQYIGSEDSFVPKTLKYALRAGLGGARRQLFNVEAMVSSIEELTNVLERQTETYKQQHQQQKQNQQQAEQSKWSSESIARMLNIETEEREQLEGNLLFQLAGAERFLTFDNRTIEMLPEVIREVEDILREGKNIHYTKLMQRYEITLSFPTEMGFPFVYTLKAPTLFKINGQVRAQAEPKVSSGERLNKPHTITAKAEISAVLSTRVEAQLGFVTPFDHQQYVSGYDKNVQVYLPLKSEWTVDIKNKQITGQMQAIQPEKNTDVFHYSSWPYTAKKDILEMQPIAENKHHQIIYSQPQNGFKATFGQKTGMAFRVEYTSEQKFLDAQWLHEQANRHDAISAFLAPVFDETIQHAKITIQYLADKSTARKVQFRLGYEKEYQSESESNSGNVNSEIREFSKLPKSSLERQRQFLKMAASGINSAHVSAYDIAVEFDGENKVEYMASCAIATSPVDKKSRVLVFAKQDSANHNEVKPYQVAFAAKSHIPNANGLDFVDALKFDPTATSQVELAFGENYESATKVNIHAKLHKSESRKEFLQSLPEAHQCKREMQQGNQQLHACANMTAVANLLDRVQIKVEFDNATPYVRNATYKAYNALSYLGYYNLDENQVNPHGHGKENQIDIEARFEPDFKAVNVTFESNKMVSRFELVRVNHWVKQLVAVHPNFPVSSRFMGKALGLQVYRPFCTIDKNQANTFDNKTYSIEELAQEWTVALQYVPTAARQHQQEQRYQQQQHEQTEQYNVLVRQSKSGKEQKEVKITFRNPESQGQLVEIEMQPAGQSGKYSGSSPSAKVTVNQKEYKYNDKDSTDIHNGLVKIYALPNGEAKIEIRHAFYVIYDGERVKITTTEDKFRGSIRGLCGNFDGQVANEFLAPQNCVLAKAQQFVASYNIEGGNSQRQQHGKHQCYPQEYKYTNVVSDFDAGRKSKSSYMQSQSSSESGCTKHQTRYVADEDNSDNDTDCFTIHPVAVCKSSCSARGHITKNVPVHCVQKSNLSQLWKSNIQKGANPDFSLKSVTKTVKMQLPVTCQ